MTGSFNSGGQACSHAARRPNESPAKDTRTPRDRLHHHGRCRRSEPVRAEEEVIRGDCCERTVLHQGGEQEATCGASANASQVLQLHDRLSAQAGTQESGTRRTAMRKIRDSERSKTSAAKVTTRQESPLGVRVHCQWAHGVRGTRQEKRALCIVSASLLRLSY